jgi:hypothetical protein
MNGSAPFRIKVIDRQTADEYVLTPVSCLGNTQITVYVLGLGTTSGGVLTVEEASWDPLSQQDNATTWSEVTTINASSASAGVVAAVHLEPGAYDWLRVRISTAISGGGTISAWLVAAP